MPKSSQNKKPTKKKVKDTLGDTTSKRVVNKPRYKSFKLNKKIKHTQKPVLGSFRILKASLRHIYKNKRVFLGIAGVYFLLSLILVSGLIGTTDYTELKGSIKELSLGGGQLAAGVSLFGVLITSAFGSTTEVGGVYQTVLFIVVSLVIIWALRQTYAKEKVTTKYAFYKSMYPLVPFLLVIFVIVLQFLPLMIGSGIYRIVISQGLAVTVAEKAAWISVVFLLGVLTLYMITSSIFALYIVTLPDLTPMKALRSARELVLHRRWMIMRKILFMPLALFVLAAIIMIPVLLYLTAIAQLFFVILSMIGVIAAHSYMYKLYRELL